MPTNDYRDWRPSAERPFPFTIRQFARLLILRGRIQEARSTVTSQVRTRLQIGSVGPTRHLGLVWICARCRAAVGGAASAADLPLCPACRPYGKVDLVARAILATAEVLAD
jgi:hypothetical protein